MCSGSGCVGAIDSAHDVDDTGARLARREGEVRHCHGEVEASRTGAPGIDVENPVLARDARPVGMPVDDGLKLGRSGLEIEIIETVNDVDEAILDDHAERFRQGARPISPVDIAPYGKDGCDLLE